MTSDYFSIRLPGLLNSIQNNDQADWKSLFIGHIGSGFGPRALPVIIPRAAFIRQPPAASPPSGS